MCMYYNQNIYVLFQKPYFTSLKIKLFFNKNCGENLNKLISVISHLNPVDYHACKVLLFLLMAVKVSFSSYCFYSSKKLIRFTKVFKKSFIKKMER